MDLADRCKSIYITTIIKENNSKAINLRRSGERMGGVGKRKGEKRYNYILIKNYIFKKAFIPSTPPGSFIRGLSVRTLEEGRGNFLVCSCVTSWLHTGPSSISHFGGMFALGPFSNDHLLRQ